MMLLENWILRLSIFFIIITQCRYFVDSVSCSVDNINKPQSCSSCPNLVSGSAYRRNMENGIVVFETPQKWGTNCYQTVYCSARGELNTDLVAITVIQVDGTMSEAASGCCGQNISVELECGGNGIWSFPGLPEYPLTPTIVCEGWISNNNNNTKTPLPITTTTPTPTKSCVGCHGLIPGPAYRRDMENGILVFETKKSGLNFSQTVYCSSRGNLCTDLVSITVTQVDGTMSEAANGACGQNISIDLECGGNNEWFFPYLPQYPLKPTIICEGSIPKKPFSTICNKGGFQQLSATANTSISTLGHFGGYFVTRVACQQLCKRNYQEKCFGYMYEAKNRGTCTIFTVPINYNIYETQYSMAVIFKKCFASSPAKKPLPFNVSGNS